MADKISMSQRTLPKVSQRYIPHNVTFKNDRNGLHFMTGASLRLDPGKKGCSAVAQPGARLNLVPRAFSQAREKTLGTRLCSTGSARLVALHVGKDKNRKTKVSRPRSCSAIVHTPSHRSRSLRKYQVAKIPWLPLPGWYGCAHA